MPTFPPERFKVVLLLASFFPLSISYKQPTGEKNLSEVINLVYDGTEMVPGCQPDCITSQLYVPRRFSAQWQTERHSESEADREPMLNVMVSLLYSHYIV